MISSNSSPYVGSMAISEGYRGWSVTQSWLAEVIRTVTTTLYAEVTSEVGENKRFAVHRSAITGQVARTFGLLLDETAPQFSVSVGIDILIQLGDLASIGQGYCIPRESRIVRLGRNWGRIAGGLPLPFSEHSDAGVQSIQVATIGRIVELAGDFDIYDRGAEHSDVSKWISRNQEQTFSLLSQDLPDRSSSQPPNGVVKFYNVGFRRARTRHDRWQSKEPGDRFAVARTTGLPIHYFVCLRKKNLSGWHWFEVSKEEARKWVLLAEKQAGATNEVRAKHSQSEVYLSLPDMLPQAWTTALLGCSATALRMERGWMLGVPHDALPLLRMLLKSANVELI